MKRNELQPANQAQPVHRQSAASALAQSLDFLTEEDVRCLADVELGTLEAWRKRGTGPAYVRFGRQYLYSRTTLQEFLTRREKAPPDLTSKLL